MRFLITGGTGLLSTRFREYMSTQDSHEWVILSRSVRTSTDPSVEYRVWDGQSIPEDIAPVDVILNMAGYNIGESRWTEENKRIFVRSRIDATHACVRWIRASSQPPKVFVSSSAMGIYGISPEGIVDEDSPFGDDFLAQLCQDWEAAAIGTQVRTIYLRTSVILDAQGGALASMLLPFKLGLGGPLASGKQGFPWMHIQDWVHAVAFLIEHEEAVGAFNMVSPMPITNEVFTRALARVLRRPAYMRVPLVALKMVFREKAVLLYGGQSAIPKRLLQLGFSASFPDVEEALKDLLKSK